MQADIIFQNFPNLSDLQRRQFIALKDLYQDWNQKINVVSRKDIEELYLRHVLHSLGISKVHPLPSGSDVLDVGTGGGFPGIPMAIRYPDVQFTLLDARGKKIKVVWEVVRGLGLTNVEARHGRVEEMGEQFDYILSRAVAAMPTFVEWTRGRFKPTGQRAPGGGILYLKGGDLEDELAGFPAARTYALSEVFSDPFFATKKVVYLEAGSF
mgnify:CR=1 FL=1